MAYVRSHEAKDFSLIAPPQKVNFNKIKVGGKTLANDVTASINSIRDKREFSPRIDRKKVERAINDWDIPTLREISLYFFRKSGIYSRLCRYMAFLYKYDYFITPIVYDKKLKNEKVIEG